MDLASPARPVLVFDGDCGFCTSSADLADRWLRIPTVAPWQRLDLESLGLDEARCAEALQWVAVDGTVRSGERAVIAALWHRGGLFTVPAALLAALRPLAGVGYRLVARNRHRLPGGTPACRL